ncbi:MAG: ATP synthase subunit C [Oscillospiraceae bacterium]|nr:ATP synthase subunit C [Oscillospiraceae bacterium]
MTIYEILEIIILPLLIVALLALPVYAAITKKKSGKSMRRAMITNLCAFAVVLLCAIALPIGGFVSAEEAAEATAAVANSAAGLGYLAAGLSVGIGSIGCGIAVGNAAPAAIGAVAEEPKSFAKALIFVALGEGVAIYGVLIAIMILSKV